MSAHQAEFPIRVTARVLRVSASGYYAWRHRPASPHAQADALLLRPIRTIHAGSHNTYGVPRVHADLQAEGTTIARKRVARLMRHAGLRGVSRRRLPTTTRREPTHTPANDLVGRVFAAPGPNLLWVADITYVPTAAGFLFLAVVLDAWSRRIVGWAMATDLRTRLPRLSTKCCGRLKVALRRPVETKLASTIAMVDQAAPMQRAPLMQRLFQRVEHKTRMRGT